MSQDAVGSWQHHLAALISLAHFLCSLYASFLGFDFFYSFYIVFLFLRFLAWLEENGLGSWQQVFPRFLSCVMFGRFKCTCTFPPLLLMLADSFFQRWGYTPREEGAMPHNHSDHSVEVTFYKSKLNTFQAMEMAPFPDGQGRNRTKAPLSPRDATPRPMS